MSKSQDAAGPTPEQRFALLMKERRESLGWSQEELARRVSAATGTTMHSTAVTRIEGMQRNIRLNEVTAIAQVLGLDMRDFTHNGRRFLDDEETENVLLRTLDRARAALEEQDTAAYKLQIEIESLVERHARMRDRIAVTNANIEELEGELKALRSRMELREALDDGDR